MHPKNQDPSPSVSAPPRHPQRPGIFCPVTVAVASPPGSDPHPEHPCCLGRGVHPPHPVLGRQVSTFSDFQPYLRQLVEHLQAMGSLRDAVVIEQVGMGTRASWAGQCRHAPALGHLLLLPGLPHPCRPWPLCALLPVFSLHFGLEYTRRRVHLLQEGRGLAPQTRPQLSPVGTHFLREQIPQRGLGPQGSLLPRGAPCRLPLGAGPFPRATCRPRAASTPAPRPPASAELLPERAWQQPLQPLPAPGPQPRHQDRGQVGLGPACPLSAQEASQPRGQGGSTRPSTYGTCLGSEGSWSFS